MLRDWILIIVGLVALIAGAEMLVRGGVWFALRLGVSQMMVGLTLVAFGTSAPELVVAVSGALRGEPGFATGTVLGSNIANAALIVGASAAVAPIVILPRTTRFEFFFVILGGALAVLPLALGLTTIGRIYGFVLLAFILVFTVLLVLRHRRDRAAYDSGDVAAHGGPGNAALHFVLVLGGLAGLYYGGEWLVSGAASVATSFGMSATLVGLTIVAIGTSLPELVTAMLAAAKGHSELALGNVLGSNIFNVGMVLGTTASIQPLPIGWQTEGTPAVVGLALVILLACLTRMHRGIRRGAGVLLLLIYVGYITVTVICR